MIYQFRLLIELVFILSVLYLIIICYWAPYSIAVHNIAIILNQGTVVFFGMFQLLVKYKLLGPAIYNSCLYITMTFIFMALILQLIRLYIHNKTIKNSYNLNKKPSS